MNFLNFLATNNHTVGVTPVNAGDLTGIGWVIGWIFDLFSNFYGAVALGVIVFTLALKTLVLPLDVYSRVKTKKQSLLMERMRPQMEKLQKQYANDKNMYSQKVMELQKANGYNPLGACLPMIVSLVVFMIVLTSFSTYSNYAVMRDYSQMAKAYNDSVAVYVIEENAENPEQRFLNKTEAEGVYTVDFEKFAQHYKPVYDEAHKNDVDGDGVSTFVEFNIQEYLDKSEQDKWETVSDYIEINARKSAAEWYRTHNNGTSFGWIGNLWYPDSMLNKEVPDFSKFQSTTARSGITVSEIDYNKVTQDLTAEKETYNGYFVLIVLSIGFMFLQQFITMRAQKAANELSSVDGSAAKTNKYMMIIMPIIFGLFSFMYSAAFSVYMITNTLYGLASTLIINKIVTVRYKNKEIVTGGRPSNKAKRLKK